MNRVNLLVLIDQLEALVEKAPEVPLVGRVLVDADELFDLLDIIRAAIPEEVKRAEVVSSEKDKLIADGQEQAKRIIAKAEEYAQKLVASSEIYRQAEAESKLLLEETKRQAAEIERGSKEYAQQILSDLSEALTKTLQVVDAGINELAAED
ncbi:MAG: hypothetical protein GX251_01530 [Firmicutes bacterium]|nr:hypothetical protein [Bacillota bacterium]